MALQSIADHVGYILVVARGDAKVLLLGTDNAPNRLSAIAAWSPLEHDVSIYRTDHYARIVAALKHRYREYSEDGFGVWFHVDPAALRGSIEEFDLESGARIRSGLVEVSAKAWVKGLGPGTVEKIDGRTGSAVVRLDKPTARLERVLAPPHLVKPYLRPGA